MNCDDENREPPPKDGRSWPDPTRFDLDDIDEAVLARLDDDEHPIETWGRPPPGLWPVTRQQALTRLDEFVTNALPIFGPHEDARPAGQWKLAHSTLSPALNLGLLHPAQVVEAVETAYRTGDIPIAGAEGFIRQVIGWREYVWGLYWPAPPTSTPGP